MKHKLRKLSLGLFICSLSLFTFTYGTAVAESPQLSNEERYEIALKSWLNKVVHEESHGIWDVQIIDSNGKWSRGCLQFQDGTWNAMTKKYGIKGSPLNCNTAKQVALAMIKDNHNNWRAWWTTCVKKGVGKPPKIEDFA